jgi:hypothetical protein
VRGEVFGVRGWRAFCGGEDPGGRAGGGRAEARARGAAAMKTEVGRAGLGAVCGGDEYGGQAVGLSGSADGLRGFRVAGAWFSGAGAVYRPPLIVSRD